MKYTKVCANYWVGDSHLHPLHFDTPSRSRVVQVGLEVQRKLTFQLSRLLSPKLWWLRPALPAIKGLASALEDTLSYLHGAGNALAVAEGLVQVLRTQDVSERGLRQQTRRVVGIFHVGHRDGGVGDAVVDDGVDGDCHRVFG